MYGFHQMEWIWILGVILLVAISWFIIRAADKKEKLKSTARNNPSDNQLKKNQNKGQTDHAGSNRKKELMN